MLAGNAGGASDRLPASVENDAGASKQRLPVVLGAEYRVRIESLDRPTYGLTSAPGYTAVDQRFVLKADLGDPEKIHARFELAAAASSGRPVARPFDRSAPDIQQAVVDVPLGSSSLMLRIGRQELDGEGNRLFAVRDGASLRRAFDMVQLDYRKHDDRIAVFYGSPVENYPGALDDRATPGEMLGGLYVRHGWQVGDVHNTLSAFLVRRTRPFAIFQDARGKERRDTLSIRATADGPDYTFALTVGAQSGRIGASAISAYGTSGEAFYKTSVNGRQLKLGVTFGVAGGDSRPGDGRLNTFDVLYPNLSYYTDAPVAYPENTWDVEPQVSLTVSPKIEVSAGVDLLSRLSSRDAIYQNGLPRLAGNSRSGSFLGALYTVKAVLHPLPHVSLMVSAVHGETGEVLARASARPFSYGLMQMSVSY